MSLYTNKLEKLFSFATILVPFLNNLFFIFLCIGDTVYVSFFYSSIIIKKEYVIHVDLDGFPFTWQLWIFREGTGRDIKVHTAQWDIIGNRARPWLDRIVQVVSPDETANYASQRTWLEKRPPTTQHRQRRLYVCTGRNWEGRWTTCAAAAFDLCCSFLLLLLLYRPRWPKKDKKRF